MPDLERERELLRKRALGWSLRCDEILPSGTDIGRDLRFEKGAKGLDLARVEGFDNLEQALKIAFTTRLGDDLFNTDFGFFGLNAIAEETNPVFMRERVRAAAVHTLRLDPRVRQILDVKLNDGRLEIPETGESRTLRVNVAVQVATGEQLTVQLGGFSNA